jgi:threonine dehydrogenase-like Zn-dependent dehydrogenase
VKTLRLPGEKKVEVVERPKPTAEDDRAVVRIRASAICGSERGTYLEGKDYNFGHEACGEIVEVDSPRRVRPGQKVILFAAVFCGYCPDCLTGRAIMCRNIEWQDGYHAEYAALPERCLLPLPDDIPYDVGALMGDALGTPYRAIKRLRVNGTHTVALFGLGPIGLSSLLLCKWEGARVIAFEKNPFRIELGRELGADIVVDACEGDFVRSVMESTEGEGADIAIDCTGDGEAESAAIACVGKGGKIAFVGENAGTIAISPSEQFIRKELTLIGSWYFALDDYGEMVKLVQSGLPLARIITHRFSLDDAQEAFDLFMKGETGKVLFEL